MAAKFPEPTVVETLTCCTPHLTSFAVGEVIDVSAGRYTKTVSTIATLNIGWLIFTILSLLLDKTKINVSTKTVKEAEEKGAKRDIEQSSVIDNYNSQNQLRSNSKPVPNESIRSNVEEIKVEDEFGEVQLGDVKIDIAPEP